ncbi:4'-phosphopantetheinyl transferase family protein [Motilibacter deserti]|uniref:4'-phosphopantetheinyl transferase superfamily protein n=1 Tax=Motilibacter deserti TaxID=2714956 RepID=A0ABX0GYH7_9ACTN|nr:4'-phosphopantetheinyl transferase superfamily protein [Motilibacter deserti]NHC16046.1 4'-phosphopantetheinyl transferase superfamily protein [Motilibacter deserti]
MTVVDRTRPGRRGSPELRAGPQVADRDGGPPVLLWSWSLDELGETLRRHACGATLSPEEAARAARFRSRRTADDYVTSHLAARVALAEVLGVPSGDVVLGRLPCPGCGDAHHGPPGVLEPRSDWRISLSRTRGYAVLAALEGAPLGVDVEAPRALSVDVLADVTLTPAERSHLLALPAPAQLAGFYRTWTRKEAVLKAIGVGIAGGVDTIDVRADLDGAVLVRHGVGSESVEWLVRDLDLGHGLVAAVAQPSDSAGQVHPRDIFQSSLFRAGQNGD